MSKTRPKKKTKKWRDNDPAPSRIVYLDASIIDGYLWGTPDRRAIAKEIFDKIRSIKNRGGHIIVKMPQLALGEVMYKLFSLEEKELEEYRRQHYLTGYNDEKTRGVIIDELVELLTEFEMDTPPLPIEVLKIARIIQEHDQGYDIKGNDLFILAHALADDSADILLTTDRKLLDDRIGEMVLEICKNELERKKLRIDDRL